MTLSLQTDPCRVEAAEKGSRSGWRNDGYRRTLVGLKLPSSLTFLARIDCYRRTLVGLKRYCHRRGSRGRQLQTDPCRVEATARQRLTLLSACYRRTLVGLKLWAPGNRKPRAVLQTDPCRVEATGGDRTAPLQTDPCRVEAPRVQRAPHSGQRLQTDPCRVEAVWCSKVSPAGTGYRRTLVGLKHGCPTFRADHRLVTDGPL